MPSVVFPTARDSDFPDTTFRDVLIATNALVRTVNTLEGDCARLLRTVVGHYASAIAEMQEFVDVLVVNTPKPAESNAIIPLYDGVFSNIRAIDEIVSSDANGLNPYLALMLVIYDSLPSLYWVIEANPGLYVDANLQMASAAANRLLNTIKSSQQRQQQQQQQQRQRQQQQQQRPGSAVAPPSTDADIQAAILRTLLLVFTEIISYVNNNHGRGIIWNSGNFSPSRVPGLYDTIGEIVNVIAASPVPHEFSIAAADYLRNAFISHDQLVKSVVQRISRGERVVARDAAPLLLPLKTDVTLIKHVGTVSAGYKEENKEALLDLLRVEALYSLAELLLWVTVPSDPAVGDSAAVSKRPAVAYVDKLKTSLNGTLDRLVQASNKDVPLAQYLDRAGTRVLCFVKDFYPNGLFSFDPTADLSPGRIQSQKNGGNNPAPSSPSSPSAPSSPSSPSSCSSLSPPPPLTSKAGGSKLDFSPSVVLASSPSNLAVPPHPVHQRHVGPEPEIREVSPVSEPKTREFKSGEEVQGKNAGEVISIAQRGNFYALLNLTTSNEAFKPLISPVASLVTLAEHQDQFLVKTRLFSKPDDLNTILGEMPRDIKDICDECDAGLGDKGNSSPDLLTNLQAIQQFTALFSWVIMGENAVAAVEENYGIFEVFVNKLFSKFRGQKDPFAMIQMEWCRALNAAAKAVVATVTEHFPKGLQWLGRIPPSIPEESSSASDLASKSSDHETDRGALPPPPPTAVVAVPPKNVPVKKMGGPTKGLPPPPPPPPPPKARISNDKPPPPGGDLSALFSEISSKGLDISKMLKHVTDEQKLYKQKNREVRTVDGDEIQRMKDARRRPNGFVQWAPPVGKSSLRLEKDKKWVIEYYGGGNEPGEGVSAPFDPSERVKCAIEAPDKKHAVFVYRCNNAFLEIGAKVNSISVVECLNLQMKLSATVGPIEITGSEKVEILITEHSPSVIADKTKELTVHLAGSTDTDIVTSCASQVRVTVPFVDEEGCKDTMELPVPEQFLSKIIPKNKVKTEVVQHGV